MRTTGMGMWPIQIGFDWSTIAQMYVSTCSLFRESTNQKGSLRFPFYTLSIPTPVPTSIVTMTHHISIQHTSSLSITVWSGACFKPK